MKWGSTTTLPQAFYVQCSNSVDITLLFILLCKQMRCNYEKNKRGIRSLNTSRIICISIITLLVFGSASVYAAVEVEIVSGTGSAHDPFADYNSNTTVANSWIVVDSNVPFSNAFNALSRNIAKLTSTAASSNLYINTTNSYIATLYTYLSNNLPGQWQTLTDIKTNTTNSAASLSALLTLVGDQVNINWSAASTFQGVSESFGGQFISSPTNKTNWNVPDLYWYFNNFNIAGQNFFRVIIPTRAGGMNYMNSYIDYIEILDNSGHPVDADYLLDYDYMSNRVIIYFLNYIPFVRTYPFVVHIHYAHTIDYFINQDHLIQYLPYDTEDYILKSDNLYLRTIAEKDFSAEISGDVTVDTSDLENKVDQVIDAIEDISLVNNDVKLNINVENNDTTNINNIIPFIRDFFDNGYGASDLVNTSEDVENEWFSQSNKTLVDDLSGGYVDLYD